MHRAIRVQTLGDLVANGYGMNATCELCRHRADLDMDALVAKFGKGFCYIGAHFDNHFVCGRCGAREVGVQIHPLHSSRSQLPIET